MTLPGIDDEWTRETAFQECAMMALRDSGEVVFDTSSLAFGGLGLTQPGAPDIIGIGPDGRFVSLELKGRKAKLSTRQERKGEEITEAGGQYVVCRTVRECLDAFGGNENPAISGGG